MIKIKDFNDTIEALLATIPDIAYKVLVTEETQAVSKVKDKKGIVLVVVIPSFATAGKLGRSTDDASTYFFVVEKYKSDANEAQTLDQYERTQDALAALKDAIINQAENGCSVFHRLEPSTIHIDPEYNIFGGFSGWSMALVF